MDPSTDPLDVIAEVIAAHRLAWHVNSSQALCLDRDCDWEQPGYPLTGQLGQGGSHSRHVAEVIRDVLAPERVEWSLRQGGRISYGNEAQCRQTRAILSLGGGTVRRRTARHWPDEIGEWEEVP